MCLTVLEIGLLRKGELIMCIKRPGIETSKASHRNRMRTGREKGEG